MLGCLGAGMAAAVCERREMFLTNHALVMAAIAGDPQLRVREIAQLVGVTERAVESIVRDLTNAGYLTRMRRGRRNHYRVHLERTFQHPMVARLTLGRLVAALVPNPVVSEKEPAGEPVTGAVIPESSISCADTGESLILSATGQQGAQEGNVKRILIYMVVASVVALSSAAAAFALRHHSGSRAHHATPGVEVRVRGGTGPKAAAMRRIAEAQGVSSKAPARERGSSHGRRHHRRKTRGTHGARKRAVIERRAVDVRVKTDVAGVGVDVRLGIDGIRVIKVGKPTGVHPVVHPPAGVEFL
jgi:hypothetical protein